MLDELVPITCESSGASGLQALNPHGYHFLEMASCAEHRAKIARLRPCPCCGRPAAPFLANILFGDGYLLLDVPAQWCFETSRIVVDGAARGSCTERIKRALTDTPVPLAPTPAGIGGAVTLPTASSRFVRALDATGEVAYAPHAHALVAPAVNARPADVSAVAFHGVARPDRMTLKIEPTTRCNFRCGFCYGRHLVQGSITADQFRRIIDDFDGLSAVEITGEGEPLVNPAIYTLIAHCATRGLWTHVTTNGSMLTPRNCERLIASGVSSIAVSLESLDPLRFAELRPGGRIEDVRRGLDELIAARARAGAPATIRLWITLLRSTLHEIEQITQYAVACGVDLLEFQTLNPLPSYRRLYGPALIAELLCPRELSAVLDDPESPPALRAAVSAALGPYAGVRCDIFQHTATVNWEGKVTPCCLLKAPDFPDFGSLLETSLSEVWAREDFAFFRFALQHGMVLQSCDGCPDVHGA
jgi:MoaA/NifB/PqqE/SkfB family radical SAM enzyme